MDGGSDDDDIAINRNGDPAGSISNETLFLPSLMFYLPFYDVFLVVINFYLQLLNAGGRSTKSLFVELDGR